ncbi:MAG TPA: dihydroorotase [Aestuariivirgaceae bacterium]|nr:dihydroorotase [Aestuariivirgaceae bacterium]
MPELYDLVLKNGTVVNHGGVGQRDVAVAHGRIAGIGSFEASSAAEVIDCAGLHVLPGVIDTHVHFREPGAEHKEDFETGSRAALAGGVTAVFEMPNTRPATVTGAAIADKLAHAKGRMACDFAFYVGASRANIADLGELERLPGCCGVKTFMGSSTGDLLVEDDASVEQILRVVSRRASFHSEDEDRLNARASLRVAGDPASHPLWRDAEAARLATQRLLRLARRTGSRVHVLHVSTADELGLLGDNHDIATVEVTPQHLTLAAPEVYERLGTRAQMNPPLRDAPHREALWRAVASGLVDVIGSDHAPHTLEEKAKSYPESPSGLPGVQTLVPLMLDHVNAKRLTIERFVDLTSHGPARLYQIAGKGRLAVGYDADFTIVNLKRRQTIANDWIESRCGWTPYDGLTVTGWPIGTLVRGRRVMWDGEILGAPEGEPVRFLEALEPRVEERRG